MLFKWKFGVIFFLSFFREVFLYLDYTLRLTCPEYNITVITLDFFPSLPLDKPVFIWFRPLIISGSNITGINYSGDTLPCYPSDIYINLYESDPHEYLAQDQIQANTSAVITGVNLEPKLSPRLFFF